MRAISFYKTESGQSPVEDFLRSLSDKERQKISWVLTLVRDHQVVPREYFKKLQSTNGIWEVRASFSGNAIRLLGFMDRGKFVVLTNGFIKKTQKTLSQEILLAEQRKKEYEKRRDYR
ncbi:MAG: type II toxin-antitoxin system RelE/ParE family toxin [Geobacteraceae bacterium]|nr:type II toxin-antitoxin system RelE/ParE family toxin [Geobacteraceae bacterium]